MELLFLNLHGYRGCACVQSSHMTFLNISCSAGSIYDAAMMACRALDNRLSLISITLFCPISKMLTLARQQPARQRQHGWDCIMPISEAAMMACRTVAAAAGRLASHSSGRQQASSWQMASASASGAAFTLHQ